MYQVPTCQPMFKRWQQKTGSSQPKGISEQKWGTDYIASCSARTCQGLSLRRLTNHHSKPGSPRKPRLGWIPRTRELKKSPSFGSRDLEGDASGYSGSQQALCENNGAPPFSESTTYEKWLQCDDVFEGCHKRGSSILSSTAPDLSCHFVFHLLC